jgi:hypothetical protein
MSRGELKFETTPEIRGSSRFGDSRLGKAVFAILFIVAAALASFLLATFVEGGSLKLGCSDCTPGMIVAERLVPPDQPHAIHAFAAGIRIWVEVDTPIWFVIICGTRFAIALVRQRNKKRFKLGAKS